MIVCLCQAVSETEIDEAISCGAQSVEAVGQICGAGTDCGSCIGAIENRLACSSRGCGGCPERRSAESAPVVVHAGASL